MTVYAYWTMNTFIYVQCIIYKYIQCLSVIVYRLSFIVYHVKLSVA